MRRNILIGVNSIFLLFSGLVVGIPIAMVSIVSPIIVHTDRANPGIAITLLDRMYEGVGLLLNLSLAIMLMVAIFEISYRKRVNTKRLLMARMLLNLGGLLLSVYMSEQLLPMIVMRQSIGDADMVGQLFPLYRNLMWVVISLGAAMTVVTQAINIGPRRDGGHPRQV